jgi:hypothetical protein
VLTRLSDIAASRQNCSTSPIKKRFGKVSVRSMLGLLAFSRPLRQL